MLPLVLQTRGPRFRERERCPASLGLEVAEADLEPMSVWLRVPALTQCSRRLHEDSARSALRIKSVLLPMQTSDCHWTRVPCVGDALLWGLTAAPASRVPTCEAPASLTERCGDQEEGPRAAFKMSAVPLMAQLPTRPGLSSKSSFYVQTCELRAQLPV